MCFFKSIPNQYCHDPLDSTYIENNRQKKINCHLQSIIPVNFLLVILTNMVQRLIIVQ